MRSIVKKLVKTVAIVAIGSFVFAPQSAEAVLEGSNRERMEFLDFSEKMIKNGLYARSGKNTYSKESKGFIRGIKRNNEPYIYEPDVYTWNLAMQEHRKKLANMAPPAPALVDSIYVVPTPTAEGPRFSSPTTLPDNPMPIFNSTLPISQYSQNNLTYPQQGYMVQPYVEQTLIPAGQSFTMQSTPYLPQNSQETMNDMIYRARARGIYPTDNLRGEEIRRGLIEHSNNMGR